MNGIDIGCRADERQRNEVRVSLDTPPQVFFVLRTHRGDRNGDTRQIQALVVRNITGDLHASNDIGISNLDNSNCNVTVVNQQTITGGAVTGQSLKGRANEFFGSRNIAGSDGESITNFEILWSLFKSFKTNLRALKVNKNGDASA